MARTTTTRPTADTAVRSTGRRLRIYPYRSGSASAAALSQALGNTRRISHAGSTFVGGSNDTVINWGATEVPAAVLSAGRVLNAPDLVRRASNKRLFFEAARDAGDAGPRVPEWTTVREEAGAWFDTGLARMVLARTVLSGHSGEGIVLLNSRADLASVREGTLLVAYKPKRHEFRVHISRNGIFAVARKAKRNEVSDEDVNWSIRNHANGFIFARENVVLPNEDAAEQCRRALAITGLDFGAVDLIFNERAGLSYVLEINTAPGLEGQTVADYAQAIRTLL